MITEDYVSFETAKLLKEKGFKHWCYKCYGNAVYHKGIPISFDEECELKTAGLENEIEYVEGGFLYDFGCDNRKQDEKVWAAPTLQMAMKWLREVHLLYADFSFNRKDRKYTFNIVQYFNAPEDKSKPYTEQIFHAVYKTCNTYEEACEAAIKYCLENLM